MPDHTKIYRSEAEKYDLLISKQPDLLETLQSICPLEGKDIIDLGGRNRQAYAADCPCRKIGAGA